jgi:hypothetical protein
MDSPVCSKRQQGRSTVSQRWLGSPPCRGDPRILVRAVLGSATYGGHPLRSLMPLMSKRRAYLLGWRILTRVLCLWRGAIMRNVMYVLMFCLNLMACITDRSEDTIADDTALSMERAQSREVTHMAGAEENGADIFNPEDGAATQSSCQLQSVGACNNTPNCGFACCSGKVVFTTAQCGNCMNRAESWCGSGVMRVFWY